MLYYLMSTKIRYDILMFPSQLLIITKEQHETTIYVYPYIYVDIHIYMCVNLLIYMYRLISMYKLYIYNTKYAHYTWYKYRID